MKTLINFVLGFFFIALGLNVIVGTGFGFRMVNLLIVLVIGIVAYYINQKK